MLHAESLSSTWQDHTDRRLSVSEGQHGKTAEHIASLYWAAEQARQSLASMQALIHQQTVDIQAIGSRQDKVERIGTHVRYLIAAGLILAVLTDRLSPEAARKLVGMVAM